MSISKIKPVIKGFTVLAFPQWKKWSTSIAPRPSSSIIERLGEILS
jgi:hypothetical protein